MKNQKVILVIVLLFLNSLTMAQKIGLLMDSYFIDRWKIDQKLISDKIKELGGECITEVAYGDADEQVRQGKKLIAEGVKVLILVPTDAKKAILIVEAATAAHVPVIAYDRFIDSKDVTFYISYNNDKVGNLQATYAMNKVPSGNYLLINGPTSDNNAILFREGQLKILQPAIDAKKINIISDIVLGSWSELETIMKLEDFFATNKTSVNAIIAANDALANGAVQSLRPELVGKVVITGQDAELTAIKNIISGAQAMTIYKPIKPLAFQAAESAITIARGNHLSKFIKMKTSNGEIDAILLDPMVVDKTNYADTVVKDGHVKLSENINKN